MKIRWGIDADRISAFNLLTFGVAFIASYGYAMNVTQLSGAPFWLPDSVLLCTLLWANPHTWWIYLALALPIRLTFWVPSDAPQWFLLAAYTNDSLKALAAAGLLRWVLRGRTIRFDCLRDFWTYFAIAVVMIPAVSGLGGAAAWAARGRDFWLTWRGWFLGNALAHLVCTPLLLGFAGRWRKMLAARPARFVECLAIFASLIYAVRFAYHADRNDLGLISPIDYGPVAFLLLAAVRMGPVGASGALVIMSFVAIAAAHRESAAPISVVPLQMFLFVIGIPIMVLSVLIEQHKETEQSLRDNQGRLGRLNAEQERILAEIRTLNQRLISAQEDERRRIGRELHDDLNQQVAVLGLQLSRIKRKVARDEAREELDSVEAGLTHLAGAIHALSHELHPAFLERTGIGPALRAYCEEFKAINEIDVHVFCHERLSMSSDLALCLYRIAQEALRNAAKHAGAKDVWVSLRQVDDELVLEIRDAGCGFHPEAVHGNGIGLVSMKDRARMAGGSVSVSSQIGEGTILRCVLPLNLGRGADSLHENKHGKAEGAHRG